MFVSSSRLAHRFYTIRQARRYIAENNLIRGDYTITEVKCDETAVHEQKSAKRLTERLFNQIYRMNRE
ncbi:MAG: hypothetical protein E7497_08205 [Ruminococcus sp.]|nr:hypothetical protein [Ruminococcus sp.]